MMLLVMREGHDVSAVRHPPYYGAWIKFRVNALCYLCEGGTTKRSTSRQRAGRMMGKTLHGEIPGTTGIYLMAICVAYTISNKSQ